MLRIRCNWSALLFWYWHSEFRNGIGDNMRSATTARVVVMVFPWMVRTLLLILRAWFITCGCT